MGSRDDSAFCRYHQKRQSPLGRLRWEFSTVRNETLREKDHCTQDCPLYKDKDNVLRSQKRNPTEENALDLANLEPEIVPVVLRARKARKVDSGNDSKMFTRKENKMAAPVEKKFGNPKKKSSKLPTQKQMEKIEGANNIGQEIVLKEEMFENDQEDFDVEQENQYRGTPTNIMVREIVEQQMSAEEKEDDQMKGEKEKGKIIIKNKEK